jgi:hypothetical protein
MNMCEKYVTTRKSLEPVLVGALGSPDASATTERALLGFKERLWLFGKVGWEGGKTSVMSFPLLYFKTLETNMLR